MPPGAKEGNDPPLNLYEPEVDYNKYKVFIQKKFENDNNDRPSISVLKVAELVFNLTNGKNVEDIRKVGRNRIIVVCTNAITANNLVNSEDLKKLNYNIYIPLFLVSRPSIVKDIDADYSTEKLLSIIDSRQFKIKSIIRLNRRIRGSTEIEPSNSIKIFFHGQQIPEYIYIWNARFPCEPFIPATKQCYKCLRYGHVSKQCKSSEERCLMCGNNGHTKKECTVKVPKCRNCKQEHEATDKDCPERLRQHNINTLMATHNISFQEASLEIPRINENTNQYSVRTENKFAALTDYENDFPDLRTYKKTQEIPSYVPPPISRTRNMKQKTTYSKVTASQKRTRHERNSSTEREEDDRGKAQNLKKTKEDESITEAQIHVESREKETNFNNQEDLDRIDIVADVSSEPEPEIEIMEESHMQNEKTQEECEKDKSTNNRRLPRRSNRNK